MLGCASLHPTYKYIKKSGFLEKPDFLTIARNFQFRAVEDTC
jgi:hypothetical protein